MVGRSLEIWSSEMDLREDTLSEVSSGNFGMAIVVVRTCYLLLFETGVGTFTVVVLIDRSVGA